MFYRKDFYRKSFYGSSQARRCAMKFYDREEELKLLKTIEDKSKKRSYMTLVYDDVYLACPLNRSLIDP